MIPGAPLSYSERFLLEDFLAWMKEQPIGEAYDTWTPNERKRIVAQYYFSVANGEWPKSEGDWRVDP